MYDRILVPTDGTETAHTAVEHALSVAERHDAEVVPIYVADVNGGIPVETGERHDIIEEFESKGREATREVVEEAEENGVEARPVVRTGVAHEEILDYAAGNDVDLIAMGTSAKSGRERFILGSTTERVVRRSDVPVMTVRNGVGVGAESERNRIEEPPSYDSVLVPTDGSDEARDAAEHGMGMAKKYGARLHVVYVVDTELSQNADLPRSIVGGLKQGGEKSLEELRETADSEGLSVTTALREGTPYDEILDYAESHDVDIVTMGSHGGSSSGVMLGSTTRKMIETSDVPVITVR
ncbi:MAG: universal stress protein [Halobacteria archaeon]|nr:universal stress protein [Halobacteria archaeon]